MKKLLSFLLIISLVVSFSLSTFALSVTGSVPSDWAVSQIEEAKSLGIITPRSQLDYLKPLTREGFCELVVVMLERLLQKSLNAPPVNPFMDTVNPYILKAYQFGVTAGLSANQFGPDNFITREQVAAMLVRAMQNAAFETGVVLLSPPAKDLTFADKDQIEAYAIESMKYSQSNNIFVGDLPGGVGRVFPKDYITSQECILVVTRSYKSGAEKLKTIIATPTPTPTPTESPTPTPPPTPTPVADISFNLDDYVNSLELIYAPGDSQNSVAQDIILPVPPTGIGLTFSTSNNVVSVNGSVSASSIGSMPISVVLTATASKDGVVKTKPFNIIVVNPNAKEFREISIYDIRLGESINTVMSRIGQPVKTVRMDANTYWAIYHTNYKDYIQILVLNNFVQQIFVCSDSFDSKIKDMRTNSKIGLDDISRTRNVVSNRYVDESNRPYALDVSLNSFTPLDYDANVNAAEQLAFEITNALRTRMNLSALTLNEMLVRSSRKHSENMFNNKFFSQTDVNGRSFYDRIKAELDYDTTLRDYDENIISAANTPQEAICGFYGNARQRQVMQGNFTSVGIGYYRGFYTQDLAVLFNTNYIQSINVVEPVKINIGEKKPLNYTVMPTNIREYVSNVYSSNPLILKYDFYTNTMEGISAGKATLTFTGSMGFTKSVEVEVTGIQDPYRLTSIKIAGPERKTVPVTSSLQLQIESFPVTAQKPMVSWKVINSSGIISVDANGVVQALTSGIATVMASTNDPSIYATCTIDVPANLALTGMDFIKKNIFMSVGGKEKVNVIFYPVGASSNLSWRSSDPSVASVDENGIITAISSGTASITAVASADANRFATTVVTVDKIWVPITSIALQSATGNNIMNIGIPLTIYALPQPANTNEMILWSSSDESIIKVDLFGNLTAFRQGNATITAKSASGVVMQQIVIVVN